MRGEETQDTRSREGSVSPFPFGCLLGAFEGDDTPTPPWSVCEHPVPPGTPRLVDLRPSAAFEQGHIPGSCHLAADEIDLSYPLPPRDRPLILLSDSVELAERAARRLHMCGYTAMPVDAPISRWPGPWEVGSEIVPLWEPSPLVATWASRLPEGPVVDLACGCGRDATFLAMRGADVTGIDLLPDALDQARRLAARHNVAVRFLQGDIESDPNCWDGQWSTINVQRFLHRGAFALFRQRLRSGGLLLCETFLEQQAIAGRKPRKPAHLLKSGELHAAAAGLSVLAYHEGQNNRGDWTASLVARKGEDRVRA